MEVGTETDDLRALADTVCSRARSSCGPEDAEHGPLFCAPPCSTQSRLPFAAASQPIRFEQTVIRPGPRRSLPLVSFFCSNCSSLSVLRTPYPQPSFARPVSEWTRSAVTVLFSLNRRPGYASGPAAATRAASNANRRLPPRRGHPRAPFRGRAAQSQGEPTTLVMDGGPRGRRVRLTGRVRDPLPVAFVCPRRHRWRATGAVCGVAQHALGGADHCMAVDALKRQKGCSEAR